MFPMHGLITNVPSKLRYSLLFSVVSSVEGVDFSEARHHLGIQRSTDETPPVSKGAVIPEIRQWLYICRCMSECLFSQSNIRNLGTRLRQVASFWSRSARTL
ncbi:hypothetical protein AVEN_182378-1 [Araneus ventricosus]|uniref:Uncharacterized protein n=1 Tax=Araneus ventricosus TaxID=182803 RepID=A0A4Y2LLG3_ARAVE|nr:hypothetical protein AVEN_182378-1 [Araneus ventricosus]